MIRDGLVDPAKLLQLSRDIEPELDRHPAVDPTTLRRAVEQLAQ